MSINEPFEFSESCIESQCPENLPYDWEEKLSVTGQLYFVDYRNRRTTWEDPRRPRSPLPIGWEERLSPEGRPQFINHKDRTTTWLDPRPTRPERIVDLPPRWSAFRSWRGGTFYALDDSQSPSYTDPRGRGMAVIVPGEPLPMNWVAITCKHGRLAFWNHVVGTVQAKDPRGWFNEPSPALPPQWEMRFTREGQVYYVDWAVGISTRDRPLSH